MAFYLIRGKFIDGVPIKFIITWSVQYTLALDEYTVDLLIENNFICKFRPYVNMRRTNEVIQEMRKILRLLSDIV